MTSLLAKIPGIRGDSEIYDQLIYKDRLMDPVSALRTRIIFGDLLALKRSISNSKHYFGTFPWEAQMAVANLLEHSLENNQSINMFIDEVILEFCKPIFSDLSNYVTQAEVILNGQPKTDYSATIWQNIEGQENITCKILPEYRSEAPTFILAGDSYVLFGPPREISPILGQTRAFRFNFNNNEEAQTVDQYWKEHILPKVAPLGLNYAKSSTPDN